MTFRLFGFEVNIKVSRIIKDETLYYIKAKWDNGDVGYYRIGDNCKGDVWYPTCQKHYANRYFYREAKYQLKLLRKLFKRDKHVELSLEKYEYVPNCI